MSIRSLLVVVFLLLLVLLGGLLWLSWRVVRSMEAASAAELRRFESWRLADELRQSSDDLTQLARLFVTTGDPRFERWFRDVLAIRNGEMPRPASASGIHWDFVMAGRMSDGDVLPAESLVDRMRAMGFSRTEMDLLGEAQRRSDALVALEAEAMHAVQGRFPDGRGGYTREDEPDAERARALMHGSAYLEAKAEIMQPIAAFFASLDDRTASEVAAARTTARRDARLALVMVLVAVACSLASVLLLLRTIVRPIRRLTARLQDVAGGEGDLTARVEEGGRSELGELGRWFNIFMVVVHDMVARVARTAHSVTGAQQGIARAATAQQRSAAELSGSASHLAVAVNEIAATGESLASTARDVASTAAEASRAADVGRQGLAEIEGMTRRLADAVTVMGERFVALDSRAAGIDRIVRTIVRVADQTNLLSLNAGLEAEKAREHGAGFRVVAVEIRSLADQTAAAVLEIEKDVRGIRDAMESGAAEMTALDQDARGAVERSARITGELGGLIERIGEMSRELRSVESGIGEQAEGIRRINAEIASLNQAAARGAESAAGFAALSAALGDAVGDLAREIGRFRIADAGRRGRQVA